MSKSYKKNVKRLPPEPRSIEALTALLHCKGGPMRDRRERRTNEVERIAIRQSWDDDDD